MEIRYITSADDKNKISKIYEDSWRYAYSGIIPQDYLDAIQKGQWSNRLEIPGWNTMVCIQDGEYIGTSTFGKSRIEKYKDSGEVISIYLLPEYIGKGYGKKIMDTVMSELKKEGFREVFLWVLEENRRARHFYENYGFEVCEDYMEEKIGGKALMAVRYVFHFNIETDKFGIVQFPKRINTILINLRND